MGCANSKEPEPEEPKWNPAEAAAKRKSELAKAREAAIARENQSKQTPQQNGSHHAVGPSDVEQSGEANRATTTENLVKPIATQPSPAVVTNPTAEPPRGNGINTSGSVKAIGVAKLRAANDGEERQKAVRITGFSKTKGLAGVDGIYAQNSPEAYFKRLPPKYCLWLCTDRIQWFISPAEEDYNGRLVEGPEDQDFTDPTETWSAVASNGKVTAVQGVTAAWTYNNVVKTGYLTKSPPPGAMKGWKRRYFVLFRPSEESGEGRLEYYENEESVNGAPKGVILLESVQSIGPGEGPRRGSVGSRGEAGQTCFRLTTADRVLELVAEHPRECRMWSQAIGTLLQLSGTGVGRIKEGAVQFARTRSDKPQSCWAILDAATLKLFPSEEDSGQVKNLILSLSIGDITEVELVAASSYLNISAGKQKATINALSTTEAESWKAELDALIAGEQFLAADTTETETNKERAASGDDPFSNFHSGTGNVQTSTVADESRPPLSAPPMESPAEPERNLLHEAALASAASGASSQDANPFGPPPTSEPSGAPSPTAVGSTTEPNPFLAVAAAPDIGSNDHAAPAEPNPFLAASGPDQSNAEDEARRQLEEETRAREAEEERKRAEAEAEERAKAEAEELARAERDRVEAEERARAEEEAKARAEAEAQARLAQEAAAREQAEAEEAQRAAEAAERARVEEEAARATAEAEALALAQEREAAAREAAEREAAEKEAQARAQEEAAATQHAQADVDSPPTPKVAWGAGDDVASMSIDGVVQHFSAALPSIAAEVETVLRDNEVDGTAILQLEEADWKELFPKVGQRRKVLNVVSSLRNAQPNSGLEDGTRGSEVVETQRRSSITLEDNGGGGASSTDGGAEDFEEDIEDLLFLLEDDLSKSLTDAQIHDYKQAFKMFDRDGDGTISTSELGQALSAAGKNPTRAELHELMKSADRDGNGTVDFSEFLVMMEKTRGDFESRVRSIMFGHGLGDTDC